MNAVSTLIRVGCLFVLACAPPQAGRNEVLGDLAAEGPTDGAQRDQDLIQARSVPGEAAPSLLQVRIRDVAAVGRSVRFRGRVTNGYDLPVTGIRYRLRLFSTDGQRTLRTEYQNADGETAPGGSQPFEIEIQSMYLATVPRFLIDAIPTRLGGSEFAAPAGWGG